MDIDEELNEDIIEIARQRNGKRFLSLASLTTHEVDMMIIKCCTGKYGAVWVESRAGNWGRAVMMKEACVGLVSGEITAINVERFHFVAVGAPVITSVRKDIPERKR